MRGRSVRRGWLTAGGLTAAVWILVSSGPPVIGQTYDEAQLAGIRQVLVEQGFDPVDDYGMDPDAELPECLPFMSSKPGPERAAGYGIRSGIGTAPAPGLVDTDVIVIVWSRDGLPCGQAIATRMATWVAGDRKLIPASPPETFAIGAMPAAVGIDSTSSKLISTIGDVEGYRRGSARGTFGCGNVQVDVLQSRLATTPTATLADRDALAIAAKADVAQTLRSLGQALVDASLCSGSWPAASAATAATHPPAATARTSIAAGPLAITVGCTYDRVDELIACLATPTDAPAGVTLAYRWTVDGQPRAETGRFLDIPVRRDETNGTHLVAVEASDPASGARSPEVSTTIAYGEGAAGPSIEVVLFGAGVGLIVLVALTGVAVRSGRLGGRSGRKPPNEPDVGESVMEALHASATVDEAVASKPERDAPDATPDRPRPPAG